MYYKASKDPIYSEIFLYPLEIVTCDTKIVQRLRKLSQLVGAEWVYPGATHTRFAHSLGVMHVAGLYASRLFTDPSRIRIIRLAGLLHDIAHGPFSHQFDDTIYKELGFEGGHDEHRETLLIKKLPEEIIEGIKKVKEERLVKALKEDLKLTLGHSNGNLEEDIKELCAKINEVFKGEKRGGIDFNIVQGPLGADRLDFVLRDSYHSGVRNYSTVALDRIVRNSHIAKINGEDMLCYDVKVIDDIYSFLFGRFMMYKNVYFHKTSRAVDLMIQEFLNKVNDVFNLEDLVLDLDDFLELTDEYVTSIVINEFKKIVKKVSKVKNEDEKIIRRLLLSDDLKGLELTSKETLIVDAYKIIDRISKRDLWKMVMELPFSTTGIDPSAIAESVGKNALKVIKNRLEVLLKDKKVKKTDRKILKKVLENFNEIFRIDTPYKLTLFHPSEFDSTKVFLYNRKDNKVYRFSDFEQKYPSYRLTLNNLIQLVRIYVTEDIRAILKKYSLIPEDNEIEATTRW